MKQIVLIVLAAMLGFGSAEACMRKERGERTKDEGREARGERTKDEGREAKVTTILVMDTTQALLPEAEIRFDKTVLRTSWDGRATVNTESLEKAKALYVSCEGYETMKIKGERLKAIREKQKAKGETLIIPMIPKESEEREGKGKGLMAKGGEPKVARGGVLYRTALAAPMADEVMVATGLMYSEEERGERMKEEGIEAKGAANGISAGKLTAGEVNDFAKWHFWPTVIDSTHKAFIDEWRLAPRERYTVQVTNKDGFPIASRAVSLLDGNGNTLFQAVTDNTGKAELWNGLTANGERSNGERLKIRVGDYTAAAQAWQTVVLDEECEERDAVDVLFVFDATGSMGDELRYLQAEMRDVIARAKDATGGLDIRTGAVVYRDHVYDEYLTRISRLTDDISVTQRFIDKQSANGGGDYPEAVPEALMAALNSAGWNPEARARIAFLVLDAPCHQDSATIALLHEQILNAAAMGVRIVPVVCSGIGESGEYLMRSIALATNGTSFFLTDDSGIGGPHLKPTTDSLSVEHLNDMLVRTIVEFSSMPSCAPSDVSILPAYIDERFVPNPFEAEELQENPTLPHGEGVHYLVDISGKLLGVFTGEIPTHSLPKGVYLDKQFIDGKWQTRKILVN